MKKRRLRNKIQKMILLFFVLLLLTTIGIALLAAEGKKKEERSSKLTKETTAESEERADTGFVLYGPDSYDSADTAVLVKKDKEAKTLTFLNLELGKRYTLSYDGTSKLYDKYGQAASMEQLMEGDIVDITFLKEKKHLNSMQLSSTSWSYSNVERYEFNTVRHEVSIGSEVYKLTEDTQYLSQGRNIEQMDLNPTDILSFQGIDNTVVSVTVEKGHGYLRLENDAYFVGGWIEIGQKQIQRITEDMLLTVAEGSYEVNISHNGGGGTKSVVIQRNEETTLDVGDLEVVEAQYGTVLFSVKPSSASLYIDGSKVDASQPIELEYGIHQIIAKASGYHSLTQYLRVAEPSGGIEVVLDKETEDGEAETDSTKTEASTDAADKTETTTGYYKVYIDAPEEAEVYLDGNYVGVAPCSFRKEEGSHVITLRKTGCETRSYTIEVDGEEKDISYSFAELTASETAIGSAILESILK